MVSVSIGSKIFSWPEGIYFKINVFGSFYHEVLIWANKREFYYVFLCAQPKNIYRARLADMHIGKRRKTNGIPKIHKKQMVYSKFKRINIFVELLEFSTKAGTNVDYNFIYTFSLSVTRFSLYMQMSPLYTCS